MKMKDSLKGALLVVASGMCWGTSGTLQAFMPEGASSLTIGSARIFFAGVLMLVWVFHRGWREVFYDSWSVKGVAVAALGLALYQFAFFSAVRLTGVAVGTMVTIGSAPALVGLLGALWFKERLTRRWFIATPLAVAGCMLLVLAGNADMEKMSVLGVILALCAAFTYAAEGIGLRIIGGGHDALDTTAVVTILSGLITLPCLVLGDISWMASPRGAIGVLLLSCVTAIIPYALFATGVRFITLGRAYTLSLTEPLTACLLSVFLLGERLTLLGVTGVICIFAGIILLAGDN